MSLTKAWDWSKNTDRNWLVPCVESAYLAESWKSKGFSEFLDLGCGLGRHSVYMAAHGFTVTAADLSDYGVDHLREWAAREEVAVAPVVCNMLDLPFEDGRFDCAMAYHVIYHTDTEGFVRALAELNRVLKPGGELFVTLISKNTWSYQRAENYPRVDENTILRREHATEMDVPHFYADIGDIKTLFSDWNFLQPPKEWCEYNLEHPEQYSTHWALTVSKK